MHVTKSNLLALDFETYYAVDYSLSLKKYNTSSYVRDEQFLIHGVGIKDGTAPTIWVPGHDESLRALEERGYGERPIVAHNTAFDGFICTEHIPLVAGFYCDTLSMARATMGHHIRHNLDTVARELGFGSKIEGALLNTKGKRVLTEDEMQKLGEYCIQDVNLSVDIFWKLFDFMPPDEMRLIDLTLRMFCDPRMLVDNEMVREELKKEIRNKKQKLHETGLMKDILMSNNKFADLLRELGVEPPLKISPATGKDTYAFAKNDPGFKELLTHNDEAVVAATEARVLIKSTINETRAARLLEAGEAGRWLPVLLNYAGAHTYRWSGGNKLNLQNLPRGGVLRTSIHAPEDHFLLVYDLGQIEARFTVWFSGQEDILHAFRANDRGEGEDVYVVMAAKLFGLPIDDITPALRFLGKACVLGLGFGMGWKKLRMVLKIGFLGAPPIDMEPEEARQIVNAYRAANPYVVAMWDTLSNMLERMATDENLDVTIGPLRFMHKMIELPSGLALRYPGLALKYNADWGSYQVSYETRNGRRSLWGGFLLENIAQALARCLIGEQMLQIRWPIGTMTHDEIVAVVHKKDIEIAVPEVAKIMTTPPVWAPGLPLAVDGGYDRRYIK
jgi:hypothetical protein